jgi:hypothetical protein
MEFLAERDDVLGKKRGAEMCVQCPDVYSGLPLTMVEKNGEQTSYGEVDTLIRSARPIGTFRQVCECFLRSEWARVYNATIQAINWKSRLPGEAPSTGFCLRSCSYPPCW